MTNAAGCGSHLKEAGLDLPVVDFSEALTRGNAPELTPLELRVAVPESCHLGHAQRVPATSRGRCGLARSRVLELLEPAEQHLCCGSAGIYNLVPAGGCGSNPRRPQRPSR